MNDKQIYEIITDISDDIKPDFASLMQRIEAQDDNERRRTREEALALMPEKTERRLSSQARGLLVTAAALLITAGLGAGLIGLTLGSMKESDSAPSEAPMDAACEEAEYYNYEPEMFNDSTEATSAVTTEESTGIIDDGAASEEQDPDTVSESDVTEPEPEQESESKTEFSPDSFTQQSVRAADMTLDLPTDAFIIVGQSVPKDFPLLKVYDMSATQLEANYKTRSIYSNALWYDDSADVTEIVVTVSQDADSSRIFNLKKAGSYSISRLKSMYLDYASNGGSYYEVDTYENEQALFFRASGMLDNADGRSNHLQYMTIINGKRIEITLIEHFGIDSPLTGSEPTEVSEQHREIMEHVIQSAHWKSVRSGFLRRSRGVIFYSLVTVGAVISIVVVMINQKKDQAAPQLAKAEKAQTDSSEEKTE